MLQSKLRTAAAILLAVTSTAAGIGALTHGGGSAVGAANGDQGDAQAAGQGPAGADPKISAPASEAGLPTPDETTSDHYRAIGNAPEAARRTALGLCEGLAQDYLDHFRSRGFPVKAPERKMLLVVLDDQQAFANYLGWDDPGITADVVYELQDNRLVLVAVPPEGFARAEPTMTAVHRAMFFHEAAHQLTLNTGLLDRRSDTPLAIKEGLAMYGEVYQPDDRVGVGALNAGRIAAFVAAQKRLGLWLPISRLLTDDTLLQNSETVHLAYGQSWLLIHELLQSEERLPGFRKYLDAIRTRGDATHRLEDALLHLGDLEELDRELQERAAELARSPG